MIYSDETLTAQLTFDEIIRQVADIAITSCRSLDDIISDPRGPCAAIVGRFDLDGIHTAVVATLELRMVNLYRPESRSESLN